MTKTPLNQTYKTQKTFNEYPNIKKTFDELTMVSIDNNFYQMMPDGSMRVKGRRYDDAVLFNSDLSFRDKIVCDLGARDGIFGAWLTRFVKKIYISDYFEEWGKGTEHDLGQIDYWTDIWKRVAPHPERMVIEHQDMTKLTYPDNFFDIVISTSVIEHIYNQADWQGDTIAMKEMARICKPGGIILMSTDMAKESKWVSGTYYYSEEDLFKRLIEPSGCQLRGKYDFSIDHEDNDAITSHNGFGPVTSVVFSLKKPHDPEYERANNTVSF
jgi:2-polyprenyl-3-methyl-5-hydroxy-6-metoxy-1,4-benzoquinol methylase